MAVVIFIAYNLTRIAFKIKFRVATNELKMLKTF